MEQRYIAGDLVRYIGVASPRVVQITEVREDNLLIDLGECNEYLADHSEVEPIPLTVEVLICYVIMMPLAIHSLYIRQ